LSNIDLLRGRARVTGRAGRARASRIRQVEIARHADLLLEQQKLLQHGWRATYTGKEQTAAEAFKAAREVGRKLGITSEGAREQAALLRESAAWLRRRDELRTENLKLLQARRALEERLETKGKASQELAVDERRQAPHARRTPKGGTVLTGKRDIYEKQEKNLRALRQELREKLARPGGRAEYPAKRPSTTRPRTAGPVQAASAPTLGEVRKEAKLLRRRDRGLSMAGEAIEGERGGREHAPNVEAGAQLALQRARGSAGLGRSERSLEMENRLLKADLDYMRLLESRATTGPAQQRRGELSAEGGELDETLSVVVATVRALVAEKRYVEAEQLLEKTSAALENAAAEYARAPEMAREFARLVGDVRLARRSDQANAFYVGDIVSNAGEGRELADLLSRNYNADVTYLDGRVAWKNPESDMPIADAIENLRRNRGQKVTLNARALALTEEVVADMGIAWNETGKGRWAEVDEGQLNALLALEQRTGVPGLSTARGRREAVPGAAMILSNAATLKVQSARDTANTLYVNGSAVDLPHERALLVSANGRILAIRAGATQFWTERPQAPDIEEVPVEIDVPAVGVPVRFEKVLVAPQEVLTIECDYHYEEVEHG